jgi:hypothetical protein
LKTKSKEKDNCKITSNSKSSEPIAQSYDELMNEMGISITPKKQQTNNNNNNINPIQLSKKQQKAQQRREKKLRDDARKQQQQQKRKLSPKSKKIVDEPLQVDIVSKEKRSSGVRLSDAPGIVYVDESGTLVCTVKRPKLTTTK